MLKSNQKQCFTSSDSTFDQMQTYISLIFSTLKMSRAIIYFTTTTTSKLSPSEKIGLHKIGFPQILNH